MRFLITAFLVALFSISLGMAIYMDPGYVLVVYHQWSLETSFWVALLLGVLLFITLYVSIHFIKHFLLFSQKIKNWSKSRKRKKAHRLTREGLCDLIEGHFEKAEKKLSLVALNAEHPLANYLGAARAAHALKKFTQRDEYLKKANEITNYRNKTALLTQAELQIKSQQWEQALPLLKRLNEIYPHQHSILKLLLTVASHINFEQVNSIWHDMSLMLKLWPDILMIYAKAAEQYQHPVSDLNKLIERVLNKEWASFLLNHYGQWTCSSHELKQTEKWLRHYAEDPSLLLCLGRLCYQLKLWGKAEQYLQAAIARRASVNAFQWLARTQEQLGESNKAIKSYEEGLKYAALSQ